MTGFTNETVVTPNDVPEAIDIGAHDILITVGLPERDIRGDGDPRVRCVEGEGEHELKLEFKLTGIDLIIVVNTSTGAIKTDGYCRVRVTDMKHLSFAVRVDPALTVSPSRIRRPVMVGAHQLY